MISLLTKMRNGMYVLGKISLRKAPFKYFHIVKVLRTVVMCMILP